MEKQRGGTKKEHGGRKAANKKRGEWIESFGVRDMAAIAPGVGSMNMPHLHWHGSSVKDMNGSTEDSDTYVSGKVTESWEASGASFSWDVVRMTGCESSYWDEEEVFNMPALIDSMAEGLIIPPPALQAGFNWLPPETPFHFTLWAD
ncbi:uncharacterized protein LOC129305609 [Prosopis cineraria]|uniref:uncharacterized protein LOC129305609 n=1 Tax=Prosopis cineraria TaxID=364024 RepID=UPI0024108246|nr:uncharacterized protein LOC129305609 [Prosopis cineraria]